MGFASGVARALSRSIVAVSSSRSLSPNHHHHLGRSLLPLHHFASTSSSSSSGAVEFLQDKDEGITETISRVRDKAGNGSLHWAAAQGRKEICRYLIEDLGIDVNLVGSKYDNAEALEVLVSKRGPMDEPNNLSGTPLLLTAFAKSKRLMKILLDHRADTNMVLSDFITPLLISAVNNALDCAKLLIMYGADANKPNILYWTVFGSSKEMLSILLDGGADPNIPNQYGRFPVEVSAIRGQRDLVEILFPLTSPIPTVSVWSVEGLLRHVKSASFKREEENLFKKRMEDLKQKIVDAIRKNDANGALILCTHALNEDGRDASIYANRSLAWLLLRNPEAAYDDALLCMRLQPTWPISYFRVVAALRSLKRYKNAMLVLYGGLVMDPSNIDIQNELSLAVKCVNRTSRTRK